MGVMMRVVVGVVAVVVVMRVGVVGVVLGVELGVVTMGVVTWLKESEWWWLLVFKEARETWECLGHSAQMPTRAFEGQLIVFYAEN